MSLRENNTFTPLTRSIDMNLRFHWQTIAASDPTVWLAYNAWDAYWSFIIDGLHRFLPDRDIFTAADRPFI